MQICIVELAHVFPSVARFGLWEARLFTSALEQKAKRFR